LAEEGASMNYTILVICMLLAILLGGTKGEDKILISQYKYDSTQSVHGFGFASLNQNLETKFSTLKNTAHGSGVYNSETTLKVHESVYEQRSVTLKNSSTFQIELIDSSSMVYFVQPFNLSKSFHAVPIRSLWSQRTSTKNYNDGVSTDTYIFNSKTLKRELDVDILNKNWYNNEYNGTGLSLTTSFDGHGHFGVLRDDSKLKSVVSLMDEDYIGSFTLTKKIALEDSFRNRTFEREEEWLPCSCTSGLVDFK
jgi:hypothetical protein